MKGFKGTPAIYVGLQQRFGKPPYFLIKAFVKDCGITSARYRAGVHDLHPVDLDTLVDDLFAHRQCRKIVEQLIKYWGDSYRQIGSLFRAYRIPLDEWSTWIFVLEETGILYEGVDHAQGSIKPPRPDRRKMPA